MHLSRCCFFAQGEGAIRAVSRRCTASCFLMMAFPAPGVKLPQHLPCARPITHSRRISRSLLLNTTQSCRSWRRPFKRVYRLLGYRCQAVQNRQRRKDIHQSLRDRRMARQPTKYEIGFGVQSRRPVIYINIHLSAGTRSDC